MSLLLIFVFRARLWALKAKRIDLLDRLSCGAHLYENFHRICSVHFEDSCFENVSNRNNSKKIRTLTKNALPTLNLGTTVSKSFTIFWIKILNFCLKS